jgi:FlaA1/EpsC-like NDP-sugar epimerase
MMPLQEAPQERGRTAVILRTILSVLLLIPGVFGLAVLVAMAAIWVAEGFRYQADAAPWMLLYIVPAALLIQFTVLTIGVVLRFARWQRAPVASLVLAITSVVTIVLAYLLLLACLTPDDTQTPVIALVVALAAVALVAGPPFLHWRAKRGLR